MDAISIENLSVEFVAPEGRIRAVKNVSFAVPEKKSVALVGESGSGKTVISQVLMGLLPKTADIRSGRVLFRDPAEDGREYDFARMQGAGEQMRALRGNRLAIIFQEPMTSLSPLHTVGDQIGEAVRLHRGMSRSDARAVTREMLGLVQFPDPERALDTYPFELSGGLRQRAMIAMALVCRPAVLIADEPTTALDVTIQAEILKLIRDMQSELDMSLLLITHDFGVVANMVDDVVVIYHGEIMESGPAEVLFREPKHNYLKALLHAVPRFGMADNERLVPIRPIEPKTGGFLSAKSQETKQSASKNIIEVESVTKAFQLRRSSPFAGPVKATKALDAVTFSIRRGECLGLVGESGSGKTTSARAILRGLEIDDGAIRYFGPDGPSDVKDLAGEDLLRYRRQVQMIFQDPFSSLNPRMTINEILQEPLVIHKIGTPQERAERARELIELVGLNVTQLRRYPHSFSGGQRQRIGIARSLALRPELILCDEPVSALDVSVQAQVLNLLKDLKQQLGLTYLFVTHNLAVVDYIADRVAVMCKGRLVELAKTRDLIDNPQHPYTKGLLAAVPDPSLDHPLDFNQLSSDRASDPSNWPDPYRLESTTVPTMIEVSDGHFVCAPGMARTLQEAV